jgi:ABC-2 type transport system ATP-binding protein
MRFRSAWATRWSGSHWRIGGDTLIGKLSKGFRQRVGIAQAIIHNPPALILDEPTSGTGSGQQQKESARADCKPFGRPHDYSEYAYSVGSGAIVLEGDHYRTSGEIVTMEYRGQSAQAGRSGTEMVSLEVAGADARAVRQRMEEVRGVARVMASSTDSGSILVEVEGLENVVLRPQRHGRWCSRAGICWKCGVWAHRLRKSSSN